MSDKQNLIRRRQKEWKNGTLRKALSRFSFLEESPARFYTPMDIEGFNFLDKVGFPGEYPYTAGVYPFDPLAGQSKLAAKSPTSSGLTRAAMYSGYGAPEDTRDYYRQNIERGVRQGPNLAMDLPTQCGYDSDSPNIEGEVGRVGVAIDTLRDLEVIYEAYQGDLDLNKIASNFTINAPAIYLIAMYVALAEKRGIPINQLRATPQNDPLKEFIARGLYIYPPKQSMRLFRDILTFVSKNIPNMNITSMGGYHIREAGATRVQDLAFSLANACAYLKSGVDAGLEVDAFAHRFTFLAMGGSMEILKEIAMQRALRRMYARILKERFGAKNPRSMMVRILMTVHTGPSSTTKQRPLNNLIRAVIGAMGGAMSGGTPSAFPPYDEPLGLGWSREAQQLAQDANRIIACEARMLDVVDPFAGSYAMEAMTDEIEAAAWAELEKIDGMGGAIEAINKGYVQRQVSLSAYEHQKKIASGDLQVVGVNCYTGEHELEVETTRLVPHPYDPEKRDRAEELQKANLTKLKKSRDNTNVKQLLQTLKTQARQEDTNLMPHLIECAKAYVSLQEVCDTLRDLWGEYDQPSIF